MVSVLIGRPISIRQTIRWRIDTAREECEFVTLLARLDKQNRSFLDFHIFPSMDRRKRFYVSLADPWLNRGQPLNDLLAFCKVVECVEGWDAGLRGSSAP
jgi:hypothetical protein